MLDDSVISRPPASVDISSLCFNVWKFQWNWIYTCAYKINETEHLNLVREEEFTEDTLSTNFSGNKKKKKKKKENKKIKKRNGTITFQPLIIIMSRWYHGYPWPSLATPPSCSRPLAGLQDNIPYPHIAAECMFVLVVLLLHGHVWGSIRVHLLWARHCFSSSVMHVWFV